MAKREIWTTFSLINGIMTITGLFETEQQAVKECSIVEAVAAVPVGDHLPSFINELSKAYAPHSGVAWEQSPMFQIHRRAESVVKQFFEKPVA